MTHAPDTGAENRLHFFPASVSGTCVMQIWGTGFVWYQKTARNRTQFYFKPETGVHMTEMMIYHRLLFIDFCHFQ